MMHHEQGRGRIIVWISIAAALMLTILNLPDALQPWDSRLRPDWLALVLIYWTLAIPHRYGLFTAWTSGLLLDVLTGTLLGQHALALALVVYLVQRMHMQMRVYPPWQQAALISALLLVYHFQLFWIDGATGDGELSRWRWLPILTSAIIWPFMFQVLRSIRLRFGVH